MEIIEDGTAEPEKQDDSLSTYAKKIEKEMGHIDWTKPSKDIVNLVRGFNPMPGAYTIYGEDNIKIWMTETVDTAFEGTAGEIVDVNPKKGFTVKTGDGAVLVTQMQAKGGKKMSSADYMRGHSIEKGIVLK
jgi:methionyl-tRNA formyltransferase